MIFYFYLVYFILFYTNNYSYLKIVIIIYWASKTRYEILKIIEIHKKCIRGSKYE